MDKHIVSDSYIELLFSIEKNELLKHEKTLMNFRSIVQNEMC